MKLRNKITGVIRELPDEFFCGDNLKKIYLKKICEEWEDAPEEPKEFYVVDLDGEILPSDFEDKTIEKSKELGNYFETKEEAEKAVKKLKAFKRLKDKGFRLRDWDTSHHNLGVIEFFLPDVVNDVDGYRKDLDICFGGEE